MTEKSIDFRGTLPVWLCGGLFFLYAATAMPGLGWRDAPEFASTTYTLGIAHPAGFPTFSLLTKIFTFIPFGSIPFRITLSVAFFQSLALYLMFRLIPALVAGKQGESETALAPTILLAGGLATLGLGLTPVVWTNASGIEVYGLNLLFLTMILACALKWITSGRDFWLYVGGLIYGISAGNHATVVFFLPGLLLLVMVHAPQQRLLRLLFLSFYFLVGFSVYLYLPIRAQAGPGFDFGYPVNWERFINQITDRKDSVTHFQAARGGSLFFFQAGIFIQQTVPMVFWFLGIPLAILGAWRTWRKHWAFVIATASIALFDVVFFISWTDPVAFLPALLISFVFIGVGLAVLVSKLSVAVNGSSRFFLWTGALFIVLIISVVAIQYPDRNRSEAFLSSEAFRGDFESLPPDAISLVTILPFHQMAYQDIYRMRPDVTVIMMSRFMLPESFTPITPDRFPLVRVPSEKYTKLTGMNFLKKFIAANLDARRDIYWQPNDMDAIFNQHLEPALDMLFKFSPTQVKDISDSEAKAVVDRLANKIRMEVKEDGFITDPGLYLYYLDSFVYISDYLWAKGRYRDALIMMMQLEHLLGPEGSDSLTSARLADTYTQIGKFLFGMGHVDEAEKRLRRAVALASHTYISWVILGELLVATDRPEEALDALNRAVELNPNRPEAFFYLGGCYLKAGQREKAKNYYQRAISLSEGIMQQDIRKAYEKHFTVSGDGSRN